MGTYGVKTGGRDFKPGESGNPNGRPRTPDYVKEILKSAKIEIIPTIYEVMLMKPEELQGFAKLPTTNMLGLAVAKLWSEATKKGDDKKLAFVFGLLGVTVKTTVSVDGGEDEKGDAKPLRVELAERIKQATEKKE